jgi:hypothetical protein
MGRGERTQRPSVKWTALHRTLFQVTWHDGVKWSLKATPEGRYPWVLYNYDGVEQEIGPVEARAAQEMAVLWLDLRDILPSPGVARS